MGRLTSMRDKALDAMDVILDPNNKKVPVATRLRCAVAVVELSEAKTVPSRLNKYEHRISHLEAIVRKTSKK